MGTTTVETPPSTCPTCGHLIDRATSMEAKRPAPGDLTICLYCLAPAEFDEELRPRPVVVEELPAEDRAAVARHIEMLRRAKARLPS